MPGASLHPQFDDAAQQSAAADLGMWTFLATEILFFGAPVMIYLTERFEFAEAFTAASGKLDTKIGLINTFVLLGSSLAMAYADAFAGRERRRASFFCLLVTILLGVVFLSLKGLEYRTEYAEGLLPIFGGSGLDVPAERLFFSIYLFLTGLHATHLLVGIGAAAWMAAASRRNNGAVAFRTRLRVTALYWHFVDIVWIFLFPFLYLVR